MSGKTRQNEGESKDNKKLLIVIIIILAVLLVAGAIVLAFALGKKSSENSVSQNNGKEGREVVSSVSQIADEYSATSVVDQMREEVKEGMFECNMNFEWTFDDGESASKNAYVLNGTNNTHPIYFDLYMQDTNELLYSSPVLPVGADLTNIKLDKVLPAGTYQTVCMYSLLRDEDSQEVISSAGFVVEVKVLN